MTGPKSLTSMLQRYGVVVAFVILVLVNIIWQGQVFLQPENLRNIVNQNAAVGIIAIGMTLVIATAGIDLSVGSLMAVSAAIGLIALNKIVAGGGSESAAFWAAIGSCLGVATALGLLNGVMIAYGRVAPFIATLVGLVAYRSLCLALAEGGEIRSSSANLLPELGRGGIPVPLIRLSGDRPLVITWGILLFLLCVIVASIIVSRLRLGRYAVAVGASERAARYSAVNVRAVKLWVYSLMGLFTGIAALTAAGRMNSVATSTLGLYYELDAIAAVVIGGTSLRGGQARIWGTFVGVMLLGVITNMLVVAGVSVYWQGVVKGAIILFAVLIQRGQGEP